ncbi:MAG: chromosomal replication initiator protein DnaA [Chloroflexi bacterium]|nr:chromosomal replication initiator protein DnaA [Chloroflexota bacterium]
MVSASPRQVWEAALGDLQVQVAAGSFESFFKDTVGIAMGEGQFIIGTPNPFAAEYLEKRACPLIQRTLERLLKRSVGLQVRIVGKGQGLSVEAASTLGQVVGSRCPEPGSPVGLALGTPLNSRYTFASFAVGEANLTAFHAAEAAATAPGQKYNPLFLYSDAGLGKTHLLHAVGHRAIGEGQRVLYLTMEQFTNEFIHSLRHGNAEEFRYRLRSAEVLLVDDIPFLVGKEQTQEAFFHTFNELHNANRRIVLTSNLPPKLLKPLSERLCSRFEWGLVVDIQPPDLETRMAILRTKAQENGQHLPEEVVQLLGSRPCRNIRELEGRLNQVLAQAELGGQPITPDLAQRALQDLAGQASPPSPDTVVTAVAQHYSLAPLALRGKRRDKATTLARHVAMYLLKEKANCSLSHIGRVMGGKDHSTVIHGCNRIARQLEEDAHLRQDIASLDAALAGNPQ